MNNKRKINKVVKMLMSFILLITTFFSVGIIKVHADGITDISQWIMANWLNYPNDTGQWGVSSINGVSALGSTQNVNWTGFLNTYAMNDKNYTFDFKMKQNVSGDNDAMGWTFRHTYTGDYTNMANHSFYVFALNGITDPSTEPTGCIPSGLYKKQVGKTISWSNSNGSLTPLKTIGIQRSALTEYKVKIVVKDETGGTRIQVYLDGTLAIDYLDTAPLPIGSYGPFSYSQANACYYDIYVNGSSINNIPPEIAVTSPTQNNKYLPTDSIPLVGTAKDIGMGNVGTISTYYHFDNNADTLIWTKTKTGTAQPFNLNVPIPSTLKYGNHTLTVWAKDDKNAESKKEIINFSIKDVTAPTLTITQKPTAWTNGAVILTATASDTESGINNIKTPDGNYVTGSSVTYTVSVNGTYSFTTTDKDGNVKTGSITVSNIEKLAPSLSLVPNTTEWTNGAITITASGTDTGGSGVKSITLPSGTIYTGSSTTYSVSTNGTYSFVVTDNAGNKTTQSIVINNIDTTAPSLSLAQNPTAWTSGNVTITATGSDGGSGVASITKPGGAVANSSTTTYTVSSNGTYTFTITDSVGNVSTKGITVSNIDKTPPTINLTLSSSNWTNGTATVNVTTSDVGSGVKSITLPNGTVVTGNTTSYTVSDIGVYYFNATDNVGNTATSYIVIANIDKEKPTVTVTNNQNWSNASGVNVTVSATDK